MSMEDYDAYFLDDIVAEYPIKDVFKALCNSINKRSEELVDMELKDEAKILSLAAHHLTIFVGE